ncbi:MAG TPA: nucleoside-triphosphatase [Chitinophagaceae bacterium]|nr:nucleoside-triphosphatase [Chitinophagaceae bacterium]
MNDIQDKTGQNLSREAGGPYYRLIAIWVLCEAMLGGIIHGFRIPVSGLVVGSAAVICICLIAWYVPVRGAIIKATIIVAIFKMMLSPQAPPPAYIAVFFQGLSGELLFRNKKFFRFSCILLAVLALLESGLQRILVLTIVYGNDLWKVINDFINGLTKQKNTTNYSLLIGTAYVFLHLVTGLLVGWWASALPQKIERWRKDKRFEITGTDTSTIELPKPSKKRKRFKAGMFIVWLLLIALYVQSYFKIGTPLLPSHISLKIFLRSLIIILAWIFIIGPLIKQLLPKWLDKKKGQSKQDVAEVLDMLPSTRTLLSQCWKQTAGNKGRKRMGVFVKMVLVNALSPFSSPGMGTGDGIFIVTGPIGNGKTTSLVSWSARRTDVYGILTPVINGQRVFMNAHTKEQFPMEAAEGEENVLNVGRFVFSKKGFDKAIQLVRAVINKPGWLIIDEIGPMELREEGFHRVMQEVISTRKVKILLVVREGLVEQVKEKFNIPHAKLISSVSGIS